MHYDTLKKVILTMPKTVGVQNGTVSTGIASDENRLDVSISPTEGKSKHVYNSISLGKYVSGDIFSFIDCAGLRRQMFSPIGTKSIRR